MSELTNFSKTDGEVHLCNRIGIYTGSFDPFHKGHLRICEYVITNKLVSCVYILPNNPCKSKPNRSDLTHRLNMIHLQLASTVLTADERERLHVFGDDANVVIDRLLSQLPNKTTKLSLILGSDRYFDCIDHNKAPLRKANYAGKFDEYIIIQRTGLKDKRIKLDTCKEDSTFFGRPYVVVSDVPDQHLSSTDVREGVYDGVNEKTIKYIQSNHLYEVARLKKIFGDKIELQLLGDKESLSDNSVYKVTFNDVTFNDVNARSDCVKDTQPSEQEKKELVVKTVKYVKIGYSFNMLKVQKAFVWFKDVHTEYYDHNILVMDKARGYRLTDILTDKAIERTMQFDEFEIIGKAVGEYIKQFHKIKQFDTDPKMNRIYWKLIGANKSNSETIEKFRQHPGHLRLVHGDLTPHNIYIDFDVSKPIRKTSDVKVILIDLDRFSQLIDQGGFPSYEYHQFISGVDYVSNKGVNNHHLVKGFFEGYRGFHDVSLPHTHKVCKDYWSHM